MKAKVISIMNLKGGVGKTTTAANVGGSLARRGFRVLLVDLDSQANLTFALAGEAPARSVYNAFKDGGRLPVVAVRDGLDLTPSTFELAGVEYDFPTSDPSNVRILRRLVEPVSGDYDVVMLDCPPSVGLVSLNALAASDLVVMPAVAEVMPLQGLVAVEQFVSMTARSMNPTLEVGGIVLSKWEGRKLNRMAEEAIRKRYGGLVFDTKIRSNIAVAEAPGARELVSEYSPRCNGAADFEALCGEMVERFALAPSTAAGIMAADDRCDLTDL